MNNSAKNIFPIVIAGGGTGGHFYPAMAIAQKLEKSFSDIHNIHLEIHYIGSSLGIEKKLIKNYPYKYKLLNIKGISRDLSLKGLKNNIKFVYRVLTSYFSVKAYIKKLNPACVIGTGSYASALPVKAAAALNIPFFLQEQNAYPGLVTRTYAKKARAIFYAYEEIRNYIPNNPPFIFSGNPVRESLKLITRSDAAEKLGLKANLPTLFIFGGSQGSHAINQSVAKFIPIMFKRWKVQIIWQTGEKDYNHIISTVQSHKSLIIKDYLHHMEEPYSLSDLIISRAGALTLAELAAMEKPAILIPLPTAAANHQYHNAKALEKLGSVRVVEENELSAGHLFNELQNFMDEPEKIEKMRLSMAHIENPDTLNIISDTILKELKLA